MRRLLTLLALCTSLQAQPLKTARVLSVTDGDTVQLQVGAVPIRVRLDSIDAPERKQAFGKRARKELRKLLPAGRVIQMLDLGQDRYHRTLAQLYLPDGSNINTLQVRNGYAWVFTRYCRDPAYWTPLQRRAQQHHQGLWKQPGAIPPWDFRHRR